MVFFPFEDYLNLPVNFHNLSVCYRDKIIRDTLRIINVTFKLCDDTKIHNTFI